MTKVDMSWVCSIKFQTWITCWVFIHFAPDFNTSKNTYRRWNFWSYLNPSWKLMEIEEDQWLIEKLRFRLTFSTFINSFWRSQFLSKTFYFHCTKIRHCRRNKDKKCIKICTILSRWLSRYKLAKSDNFPTWKLNNLLSFHPFHSRLE
jgi:hypothetical protein